ncbi:MAG: serine/threonine protein kinase [Lachnospiraceae bacterium]
MDPAVTILIAMGVPSAITGFCFWLMEKKIEKRQKEQDKKDEARKQNEIIVLKGVNAAIALGEATARAVQRIPDAHCNGDMHQALEYAEKIKHEQKDFLTEQGVEAIY